MAFKHEIYCGHVNALGLIRFHYDWRNMTKKNSEQTVELQLQHQSHQSTHSNAEISTLLNN